MQHNPLPRLTTLDQSVWLDDIRRALPIAEKLIESRTVSAELTMLGLDPDALGEQLQCERVRKL
jgi:hypothetical protein